MRKIWNALLLPCVIGVVGFHQVPIPVGNYAPPRSTRQQPSKVHRLRQRRPGDATSLNMGATEELLQLDELEKRAEEFKNVTDSQWKNRQERGEYEDNRARLLDFLTYAYPVLFEVLPNMTLFTEDVVFEEPSGIDVTGRENYQHIFEVLHVLRRPLESYSIQHKVVWDESMKAARVRWHLKMKMPLFQELMTADGISIYYLNKRGLCMKHEVTLLNARPPWLLSFLRFRLWLAALWVSWYPRRKAVQLPAVDVAGLASARDLPSHVRRTVRVKGRLVEFDLRAGGEGESGFGETERAALPRARVFVGEGEGGRGDEAEGSFESRLERGRGTGGARELNWGGEGGLDLLGREGEEGTER
uniref:SnoaL-like domain-containing protein n=1 Tax=Chromera velia CCMP2878 TaxID=1169474 RepID=A0A0G4FWP1_9ALVE|eukprot:Cvel_3831.t1-p1 / transcript=Cvel_3831.t1 / gene=Cvel_3831 / organism=Chromera_velia_CCMP2878 / gene_product=hypothetical protein / transcript_product=hypothetical protein / location=Cvel_scaffold162:16474-19355(-) / protein_length=358 / sequence_SO=supercontig / SO=protein_coding / is_pseudo=false